MWMGTENIAPFQWDKEIDDFFFENVNLLRSSYFS